MAQYYAIYRNLFDQIYTTKFYFSASHCVCVSGPEHRELIFEYASWVIRACKEDGLQVLWCWD